MYLAEYVIRVIYVDVDKAEDMQLELVREGKEGSRHGCPDQAIGFSNSLLVGGLYVVQSHRRSDCWQLFTY